MDLPVSGLEGQAFDLIDLNVPDGSRGTVLVRPFDVNGNGACYPASYVYAVPATDTNIPPGPGLWGEYFPGPEPAGTPALSQADSTINFNWGSGAAWTGGPVDNFSIRWTGTIALPSRGSWTFFMTTDDGRRLWIDGAMLIDFWQPTWSEGSWTGTLEAGDHAIVMEYFEGGGGALCQFSWQPPGGSRGIVPASALSRGSGAVTGVPIQEADQAVAARTFDVRGRLLRGPPRASGIYFQRTYYRSGKVTTHRLVILK